MYGVRYNDLMIPMVKALQELTIRQDQIIESLKLEMDQQKLENENLLNRIEKLEASL